MAMPVLSEQHGRVKLITINRPEVKNAVDAVTMNFLREAILESEHDQTRVVVVTGAGGSFCSGADIKAAMSADINPEKAIEILQNSYGPTLKAIRDLKWPVIAAIDGAAAGIGLDLALACDLRLASERAVLSELFIKVGLIPDGGGTWTLQRLVGEARAREMTYTGMPVDAAKALDWGLVNHVYPVENFGQAIIEFASHIAMQSPDALRLGKKAITEAMHGSYEEALQREANYQRRIFEGKWGFEGFQAFIEKRPPRWMEGE